MLEENAAEEIKKITAIQTQTEALRQQFEDDFDFVRNEKFTIPKKEGEWESYTTNRPSTDAFKTINALASAHLSLKILLADEGEKERENLSATERFPYGIIALRDELITGIPEDLPLHESLCWHAVVRGWVGVLLYLHEEEDGKNGAVRPHIPVLDILNTFWMSGSKGLIWYCTIRYASQADVKEQYKEDVKPDTQGRVVLYNIWDKDQFGTAAEGKWLDKRTDHGLGHIPALILPVGATPYVQSGRHTDTIKNVGRSFAADNRHLYPTESRMGSYLQTMAGEAAHAPLELHYDSTKGGKPIELQRRERKGSTVPIDDGKGQSIKSIVTPEMTRDAYSFFEYLQGRLGIGGHTPVAFGQINQALPAAGINILRHASMDSIKPPQRAIEKIYEWLAHEGVSQYKSGPFANSTMEIQGIDGSHRRFKMEVKPDDIDDSWKFEAHLLADFPQDDKENAGMAVMLTEAGGLSWQSARDKYNLVDDTDLEQTKIDREKVFSVAAITMRKVAKDLRDKMNDPEGAQYIEEAIAEMRESAEKGVASRPGVANQSGVTAPVRPSADASAVVPKPPGAGRLRRLFRRSGGG